MANILHGQVEREWARTTYCPFTFYINDKEFDFQENNLYSRFESKYRNEIAEVDVKEQNLPKIFFLFIIEMHSTSPN